MHVLLSHTSYLSIAIDETVKLFLTVLSTVLEYLIVVQYSFRDILVNCIFLHFIHCQMYQLSNNQFLVESDHDIKNERETLWPCRLDQWGPSNGLGQSEVAASLVEIFEFDEKSTRGSPMAKSTPEKTRLRKIRIEVMHIFYRTLISEIAWLYL